MSDNDRKRNLSESSGEGELRKLPRVEDEELTDVTGQSDSDSSSDSGSESDSESSSSSSSGGEETRDITQTLNLSAPVQTGSDKATQNGNNESGTKNAQRISSVHSNDLNFTVDSNEDLDKVGPARLGLDDQSDDLVGPGSGLLDEIQQFLTVTAEGANHGSAGPVDPVFVDHEDSQHANNLDSLVFDSQIVEKFGSSEDSHSIPGMEDMNEPRLDSVCNSNINSTEGSLILGTDFREDGELPSSPENGIQEKLTNDIVDKKPSKVKDKIVEKKSEKEPIKIKVKLNRTSHSNVRPNCDEVESDVEEKVVKKKKKSKKRKKDTKESETEVSPCTQLKHRGDTQPPLSQCHISKHSKVSLGTHPAIPMSDLSSSHTAPTNNSYKPRSEQVHKSSTRPNPPLPISPTIKPSPPTFPSCVNSLLSPPHDILSPVKTENLSSIVKSEDDEIIIKTEISNTVSNEKKARKLSLKDYKAKKEAEKHRKSLEESGSESASPVSGCHNYSKEGSPEPSKTDNQSSTELHEDESQQPSVDYVCVNDVSELETVSDNDDDLAQIDADNDVLSGFDVLDELLDNDSEDEPSKESGDESDSLAEDEVDRMLEEDVPKPPGEEREQIEPQEKLKKLVLEERGGNLFEVLPLGWVSVTHNSGMPLYLHRETRVVTTSRPYDLGNGSVRKHNIPISAIPCYSYRYYSNSSTNPALPVEDNSAAVATTSQDPTPSVCPYSRENVSPDSTTDGGNVVPSGQAMDQSDENVFPKAKIETIEETMKKTELSPTEVTKYCEKVFVFKELEVAKFKTWKERRAYYKQTQKTRLEKELTSRPTLPEGTKIITIPSLEMVNIPGTEGDSALNQKVVKKTKKKWVINPVGKSMVCLLHEYVQQSLKMQPYYTFTELDNAATPYGALVHINKLEYGRGTGSSKKIAKSEAARRTLEMLIPEIKDKLPQSSTGSGPSTEEGVEGPDLSFFNDIRVEDPRVADLCNRTSEPAPYQILVTCLQRNYGLGDTHINQELKAVRNGKNEYTMKVDKREVSVICKNKKDGKQLAAAKLLQQLHPHITSWGSLLRMYGNRSLRKLKIKKDKETEVTGLQSRSSNSSLAPSMAILGKLKEEMRNLREIKKSIAPIGKFVLPDGVGQTGLNTDHVDL